MTKPLPPTLREKNRYLVLEFLDPINKKKPIFDKKTVRRTVWSNSLKYLGERGIGETSLRFIDWNERKQLGIVKVNHKSVDDIRVAIALIRDINGKRVIPRILRTSGTIKKLRTEFKL